MEPTKRKDVEWTTSIRNNGSMTWSAMSLYFSILPVTVCNEYAIKVGNNGEIDQEYHWEDIIKVQHPDSI